MSLEYIFENRGTVQVRPSCGGKRNFCWYILGGAGLLLLVLLVWLFFSGYLTSADSSGVHALTLRGKMDEQEKLIEKQAASIRNLEDQLALYEEILSPEGLEEGLNIQHFSVKERLIDSDGNKVNGGHLYQYHLVMANIRGGDASVKGSFSITVTGKQDGKEVTVTQKDVTPKDEKTLTDFDVKHYQSLEGSLLFPKDFVPVSVKVRVSPESGDAPDRLTKSYNWASFSKAGSASKAAELTVSTTTNKE